LKSSRVFWNAGEQFYENSPSFGDFSLSILSREVKKTLEDLKIFIAVVYCVNVIL
jgi:hypothetical protein